MASRATASPKKNKADYIPAEELNSQRSSASLLQEKIRARAHAIYLERGGHSGSDIEDWLQAEREIRSEEESSGSRK